MRFDLRYPRSLVAERELGQTQRVEERRAVRTQDLVDDGHDGCRQHWFVDEPEAV